MKPQTKQKYTMALEIIQGIIGALLLCIVILIIKNF